MYMFMKAMSWGSLDIPGVNFKSPKSGIGQPQYFVPVFDLEEDALKYAGKDKDLIVEVQEAPPVESNE